MITIDWNNVLDQLANGVLPELVKVVFYAIILPIIAGIGHMIHKKIVESHFGFIIKLVAQRIPTTVENWQEKRLAEAVTEAKNQWFLKWIKEDDMKNYIEVAVRTYRDALMSQGVDSSQIH